MAQRLAVQRALPLSLAVAGSHAALELILNILPLTYPLLVAERGFSYTQIGTLALVASLCGSLTQPLFGWFSDRFDAKKLVIISLVWIAAAMSLLGISSTYTWVLVCVGLATLASAAYHPSGASLVSRLTRKGRAMSLFAAGGSLGAALSPLMIAGLLSFFGLPGTLFLLPIGLVLAVLIGSALRPLPRMERPSMTSLTGRGGSATALILIITFSGVRSWVEGALVSFLPEWQIVQGGTLAGAGRIMSLFLVAMSLGGLVSGFLSDRFGKWPVAITSVMIMPPAYWLFLNGGSALAPVFLAVIGAAIGASNPIAILMAQQAWPKGVGMASSLVIGIGWLPAGIGAWAMGQLADRTSLDQALTSLTWVPLIAVGAMLAYRFQMRRVKAG
ncbi:MAG: MFS transporter [Ardenticatenaceae bacterium]|nr:MFS transporter [Ardenticatenaceae bacterium]